MRWRTRDWAALDLAEFSAEWKWDGIRVQIVAAGGRGAALLAHRRRHRPELSRLSSAGCNFDAVLDGELLVVRNGEVAPFNDLQQRLNRKGVTKKQLEQIPGARAPLRCADDRGRGPARAAVRRAPRAARGLARDRCARRAPTCRRCIDVADKDELQRALVGDARHQHRRPHAEAARQPLRRRPAQGRMVQVEARAADARLRADVCPARLGQALVLLFGLHVRRLADECRGGQRRSWCRSARPTSASPTRSCCEIDRWVRNHTTESFGPVRAVTPELVFEVAFDAVQKSTRHKSGVAMRFPRIHRIRWDKPAAEADRLETLVAMIEV